MGIIRIEKVDQILVAKLNRGVTNAINMDLVSTLETIILEVKDSEEVSGFVLTSANEKFFSIGFDIPELYDMKREEFHSFFRRFNHLCLDIFTLPKPTVAAIPGHVVAGGCVLALSFDYRFIAAGHHLMGLNEIKFGIPLPYSCDCMLRNLVGFRNAREIADSGEFFEPQRSLSLGLVDRIIPPSRILPEALQWIEKITHSSSRAFALIKQDRVHEIRKQILAGWEEKDRQFTEYWYSKETRSKLKQAMDRFQP